MRTASRRQARWRRRVARIRFQRYQHAVHPGQLDMPLGEIWKRPQRSQLAGKIIWPILLLVFLVIQTRIRGVKPDLVLLAVIFAAIERGPASAAITGFAAGLFQDIHTESLLGTHAFCNVLVGSGLAVVARNFYSERSGFQFLMVFAATAAAQLLFLATGWLTGQQLPVYSGAAAIIIRIAAYNTVLALPVFAGMRYLTGWGQR